MKTPRTALDVTATTGGTVTVASRRPPPYAVVDTTIDTVRDETFLPASGQVRYELTLNDEQVELLSRGIVSEALCCRAYKMLEWKRTAQRVQARCP